MNRSRKLIVTADDYGIGPETSRAIRELGSLGRLTSTVLLVNSPYACHDISDWFKRGKPVEMGWHPNLTMDKPILAPEEVPSLVDRQGKFLSLGKLGKKLFLGTAPYAEIRAELEAQYERYMELVGQPPRIVNGHKHIHIFPVVGAALRDLLVMKGRPVYLRQLGEPLELVRGIPGARIKRLFLSTLGRWSGKKQQASGLSGNDVLAGVTDPVWVKDPEFFVRWLQKVPGRQVELMVHPGHYDPTLLHRDCDDESGLHRRIDEWKHLSDESFVRACRRAGFQLVTAEQILRMEERVAVAA